MSQGPETRFIASVHRQLPEKPYRMKNHNSYLSGPADVWYSGDAADMWVEYKFVLRLPPVIDLMDTKKKYSLSALQQEWLRDRFEEGRDVRVILGCEDGGVMFVMRTWEAQHKRERVRMLTRVELAVCIYETVMKGKHVPPTRRNRKVLERVV